VEIEIYEKIKLRGMTLAGALTRFISMLEKNENLSQEVENLSHGNMKLQAKLIEYSGKLHQFEEQQKLQWEKIRN